MNNDQIANMIRLIRRRDAKDSQYILSIPEYVTAFYLLSVDDEIGGKARHYVMDDGIDFGRMREQQEFEPGHDLLVRLAANLFNGTIAVDPIEICGCPDDELFKTAINAMRIRRYGLKPEDYDAIAAGLQEKT